ncbi:MAG TPA: hydantoinase/oxoprolinase family protein [Terriglobales bacterium]|nr:hydantoinase/oxoprolinase family protein [Terriglobales bacterium]
MRIAVDTGGTFTDCVFVREGKLQVLKVFSTPADPGEAIVSAIREIGPPAGAEIRHGTTVGTNTLLERKGARVAFVTTAGFEDTIAIGRQARSNLYNWFHTPAPPLAPAELRFGVAERVTAEGEVLRAAGPAELHRLVEQVRAAQPQSIAVSLLFSFANAENERAVGEALAGLGLPVSLSSQILPEFREYERASTVVVNAYLAPRMGRYISGLEQRATAEFRGARLLVMQSSGGIVSAATAAREPVRTVLSGPAGGVVGASHVARLAGFDRIIAFDMGGTSTDVSLVDCAGLRTTNEAVVSDLPISVPMLDIHTVGAGGGSLAHFDSAGVLHVGPQSAGADPGPICYVRGTETTVTDANLLLHRLDPEHFLGGQVRLDHARAAQYAEASRAQMPTVVAFASGIVRLAEATMEKAIRVISVERGHDPREFTLVAFGGAGPLHACALARALRIPRVLVPQMPGALSALGILISDVVKDYSRTVMLPPDSAQLEILFRDLEKRAQREFASERLRGAAMRSLDFRYVGQGYELNVAAGKRSLADFHAAHEKRYGYADARRPVEVVNVRLRMIATSEPVKFHKAALQRGSGKQAVVKRSEVHFEGRPVAAPLYAREQLRPGDDFAGPAIVAEYSATTVIPPGCKARVDAGNNLVIEVHR